MESSGPDHTDVCPVKYTLKHARRLISICIPEILAEPQRVAIFNQLKIGSRLILYRDYLNRRVPSAVRIARDTQEPLAYLSAEEAASTAPLLEDGNYLYAVVTEIDRANMGFKADVYLPEQVGIGELVRVTLEREDSPHVPFPQAEKFTLLLREHKLLFEEKTKHETVFRFELVFTPAEWQNTLKILQVVNFLAWEENYNESEDDYDSWSLSAVLENGNVFRSTGSRIYPAELDVFRQYLDTCLEMRNKKGSGTFCVL